MQKYFIVLTLKNNTDHVSHTLGTHIYALNGSDPEGQPVRYGLGFDPGSKEYFSVDPISGIVTLTEELDREVGL